MIKALVLCAFLGAVMGIGRFTDFDANHEWFTNLETPLLSSTAGRRLCLPPGNNNYTCYDNYYESWNNMRSFATPSTIQASYSGTVDAYKICKWTAAGPAYTKLTTDSSCGTGWAQIDTINLITDPTGWTNIFTVGGNTWEMRVLDVWVHPSGTALTILSMDKAITSSYYSYSFRFYVYRTI